MRRKIFRLLPFLIVPVVFLGFTANGASAAGPVTGRAYTWHDYATGRCLDSNAVGSVYTLNCNGGDYQRWTAYNTGYKIPFVYHYKLVDLATGRCLDSNSAGSVYTLGCNGGDFQNWYIAQPSGSLLYRFVNVATGRCLDSNSAGSVYTLGCNGGGYQLWDQWLY
jgi:Ricin-type beta-trefoil lectin domain-like